MYVEKILEKSHCQNDYIQMLKQTLLINNKKYKKDKW